VARDLLLLHGWGMDRRVWEPVLPELSGPCRVHNLGLPGYPGSCIPLPAATEPMTGQSLLDHWSDRYLAAAPAGAVWLGWSLGAMIVMNAALRSPGAMKAAILVAPTPRFIAGDGWDAGVAPGVIRDFLDSVRAGDRGILRRFVLLQARDSGSGGETASILGACLADRTIQDSVLEAGLTVLAQVDLRRRLEELNLPVLVIHGEADRVVPAVAGAWIADRVPRGELVSMPTGHAPFVAKPREFAKKVLAWI